MKPANRSSPGAAELRPPLFLVGSCLALSLGFLLFAGMLEGALLAAEAARKTFDLSADLAANSLKAFAKQSGIELVIRTDLGRTVRTQPVRGEFTPREALERLLERTGLMVKEDPETGVMAIVPATPAAP